MVQAFSQQLSAAAGGDTCWSMSEMTAMVIIDNVLDCDQLVPIIAYKSYHQPSSSDIQTHLDFHNDYTQTKLLNTEPTFNIFNPINSKNNLESKNMR